MGLMMWVEEDEIKNEKISYKKPSRRSAKVNSPTQEKKDLEDTKMMRRADKILTKLYIDYC